MTLLNNGREVSEPQHQAFGRLGGKPYKPTIYNRAALKAELDELVRQHCFQHSSKVVNAILDRYDVTPKEK